MANDPNRDPNYRPPSSIIEQIAIYIIDARQQQPQSKSADYAMKCAFDVLCAAGAGHNHSVAASTRNTALVVPPGGNSPIWFTDETCWPIGAASANSAAAIVSGLSCYISASPRYLVAAVIVTALAIAPETQASSAEWLNAIIIGTEVGVALARTRTVYGNTGTWVSYAVVATAAAVLKSSRAVIEHALAIVGVSALNQSWANATDPSNEGPEAAGITECTPCCIVAGLEALELVQYTLCELPYTLHAEPHGELRDHLSLGANQYICASAFKRYCCNRYIHGSLDALEKLIEGKGIDYKEISSIEVETCSMALGLSNTPEPKCLMEVQDSHAYCLALVARYGTDALRPLTEHVLNDPDVIALAHRVKLVALAEFDKIHEENGPRRARVIVTWGSNRLVSPAAYPTKGCPTWDQIEKKFKMATQWTTTIEEQAEGIAAINSAKQGNFDDLIDRLSKITRDGKKLRLETRIRC